MKRFLCVLAVLLFFLPAFPAGAAGAALRPVVGETEGRPGDTAEVSLFYDGSLGELGAFSARLEYDSALFELVRLKEASCLRGGYAETLAQEGRIAFAYTMSGPESGVASPGELFTCTFKIREDAGPQETSFLLAADDPAGPSGGLLSGGGERSVGFTVLPALRDEAFLLSLAPSEGTLDPEFSPGCFEYSLTVPFQVTSLGFVGEAAEGGSWKVNRKNLGAGGSETVFLVTVTAEDGKTKSEYRVTALRQEKDAPSPTPTPEPAAKKTPAPGKNEGSTAAKPTPAASSAKPEPVPSAPPGESSGPEASRGEEAGNSEGASAQPTLVIRNGETSAVPMMLAFLFLAAVTVLARPLARRLCIRRPGKHKK